MYHPLFGINFGVHLAKLGYVAPCDEKALVQQEWVLPINIILRLGLSSKTLDNWHPR
jgi:hypothetical protein